ncbi:MAG: transcriptional regulator, partial [Candidatus Hydrogenedentes bacterium]|nr:transcriptional regulator [Candidatus Hydrogenedentota bacterium]
NDYVPATIDAIIKGAKTGNIGDGKIFVIELADCIRIRTNEVGELAVG